jgi:hypothetical protein
MRSWPQRDRRRADAERGWRLDAGCMSVTPTRQCRMASIAGRPEECPEDLCPFWEPGGAVLSGRCGFEQIDLADNPDLAGFLLRIRHALEHARTHQGQGK